MNCVSRKGYWNTMWLPWPIGSHYCWLVRIGMWMVGLNILIIGYAIIWRIHEIIH